MTTLIAVYNYEGCVGRCDARCYDAADEPRECICQGRNHAAGRQEAIDNTPELAESWLERARAGGQDITCAEMAIDAQHQPLFDLGSVW
jgi:hypothetical protein